MTAGAAKRLAEIIGIPSARRMECYDISNISGVDKVSSQVVFIDGKAEIEISGNVDEVKVEMEVEQ